ncbi:MAG: phosphate signaling complex PhoU family protein [bacterium]
MSLQPETTFELTDNLESVRRSTVNQPFFRDMEKLWTDLLRVAAIVEDSLNQSIDVLVRNKSDLANDIINNEKMIDRWEISIEEKCLTILARHQPVASDLRRVAAVLKLNSLLERLSDLSSHIAIRSRKFNEANTGVRLSQDFLNLAEASIEILTESLNTLTDGDSAQARKLLDGARFARINRLRSSVRRDMKQAIRDNIENFDSSLRIINIARNFKRVAEHALDIAVETVYMKEGVIIRHQSLKQIGGDDVD